MTHIYCDHFFRNDKSRYVTYVISGEGLFIKSNPISDPMATRNNKKVWLFIATKIDVQNTHELVPRDIRMDRKTFAKMNVYKSIRIDIIESNTFEITIAEKRHMILWLN
jgi:hypothetical protein